ncbi:MAG: hypothetical protein WCI53_12700 [Bacteroidota bacterium]
MKSKETIFIFFMVVFVTTLSCNYNNSKKEKNLKEVNLSQALQILDSVKKNVKYEGTEDTALYMGDKGFDVQGAKKAQNFVVKVLGLDDVSKDNIDCYFFLNDSSYMIEIRSPMSKERSYSTFYRFYPKTKVILNGVSFDTIKYKSPDK